MAAGGAARDRPPARPGRGHRFDRLSIRAPDDGQPARKDPFAVLDEDEDDEFATGPGRGVPAGALPAAAPRDDLPHQGSATIVCDGSGGYRVSLGWAATARCGIGDCVERHEASHAADWEGRWPDGCRNADGSAKPDGTAVPTGGDGYAEFLRRSECTAYRIEIPCEERLLQNAPDDCKDYVRTVLADSRSQETHFCS